MVDLSKVMVSFPIKHGDFPSCFVCLPEGIIFHDCLRNIQKGSLVLASSLGAAKQLVLASIFHHNIHEVGATEDPMGF